LGQRLVQQTASLGILGQEANKAIHKGYIKETLQVSQDSSKSLWTLAAGCWMPLFSAMSSGLCWKQVVVLFLLQP
jgi:hypothetical protein